MKNNIHIIISFRGFRQDSFKFAFGHHGGKKSCFTRGCEILTPSHFQLKGVDVSPAILREQMFNGEIPVSI